MIDITTGFYRRVRKVFGLRYWLDQQKESLDKIEWDGYALDAGCGPFWFSRTYTSASRKIVNLDLEFKNKYPLSVKADLHNLPFKNSQFNFIFCRFVMEHLHTPEEVIKEFSRITCKGGHLLLLVPNIYSLGGVAALVTPHWFHNFWRRKFAEAEDDNAPTYYKANTVSKQKTLLSEEYNIIELARCDGWSGYFKFSKLFYLLAVLAERICGLPQVTRDSFWIWVMKK